MAYTTIDDPSAYFQTALWSGDDATTQNITNDGNSDLQPDWVWVKCRNTAGNGFDHTVWDTSRGVDNNVNKSLSPSQSDSEGLGDNVTTTAQLGGVSAMLSDGFTVREGSVDNDARYVNENSRTYVAWQWKANGGTTSSDSNGGITSTVQASTTAGFSITKFDSTSASGQATVGHGLGAIPHVIIMKDLAQTYGWDVHHIKAGSSDADGRLVLNTNDAWNNASNVQAFGVAGSTSSGIAPTSTTFSFNQGFYGSSGDAKIIYCFTPIQGYSKFGSYIGNGNADGAFIYLGFKPAFVIIKSSTKASQDWHMFTGKIATGTNSNPLTDVVDANQNIAERGTFTTDFLSNGFKIRHVSGGTGTSGETYVYMAFAESPFVSSEGVPTTAR